MLKAGRGEGPDCPAAGRTLSAGPSSWRAAAGEHNRTISTHEPSVRATATMARRVGLMVLTAGTAVPTLPHSRRFRHHKNCRPMGARAIADGY